MLRKILNTRGGFSGFLAGSARTLAGLADTVVSADGRSKTFSTNRVGLWKSDEYYRKLFEEIAEALLVYDGSGRVLDCNAQACESLGYSRKELLRLRMADIESNPTSGGRPVEGSPGCYLARHRRKDGTSFPVEVRAERVDHGGRRLIFAACREVIGNRRSVEELQESQARLVRSQRLAGLGSWEWDESTDAISPSDELCRIHGLDPEGSGEVVYEAFLETVIPEDREVIEREIYRAYKDPAPFSFTYRLVRPDGEERIVESRGDVHLDGCGEPTGVFGTALDVTARARAESRLSAQYAVARTLAEASTLEEAAPEILRLICHNLGWEAGELWQVDHQAGLLRHVHGWQSPATDLAEFGRDRSQRTFARGVGLPGRIWESGEPAWVPDVTADADFPRSSVAEREGLRGAFGFPVPLGGEVSGVVSFFSREARQPDREVLTMAAAIGRQIGQFIKRRDSERRLQFQALHDSLTGLPNRVQFRQRLQDVLDRPRRSEQPVAARPAVLLLDLDDFKHVNNSLGRDTGDRLLSAVADRLQSCLRPGDTVARLGGDEFAGLLSEVGDLGEAERVAGRILESLVEPFSLEGYQPVVSASIGVALADESPGSPEDLLRSADMAMYKAKSAGKACYAVFDPEIERCAVERLDLEHDMRKALEREEFVVHYQPIIVLETGRVVGMEALARWEHPRRGTVSPAEFIPIAEENGLIVQIGDTILRQACRQVREWQERYPSDYPVIAGVNLSPRQLQHPRLVEEIQTTLRETGLSPASLTLEITESMLIEEVEQHGTVFDTLKGSGIGFAIDDFGTGYSSLSYLRTLPAGLLKIDRSFVQKLGDDVGDETLLSGVIDIAHGLGLGVTAEGIETPEQAARLKSLGCDLAQGFYFAKPLPAPEAERLLANPILNFSERER